MDQVKTKLQHIVTEFENMIKLKIGDRNIYKKDHVRHFGENNEQLIFALDNLNGDDTEINELRKEITEAIQYLFDQEDLPTSWGFFHLLLRYKYESEPGYCSLQEAVKLAGHCRIERENVEDVLTYFHDSYGTVFYFKDVEELKNIVICDPNLVFHPITKLVAESFGANPMSQTSSRYEELTGEIELKFFEKICKKEERDKSKSVIDAKMTCKLLQSLQIISEISDDQLFMSCLLLPYPKKFTTDNLLTRNPSPLVFTFSTGYQPVGLYHILLANLLSKKDQLRVSLHEKRYRNFVSCILMILLLKYCQLSNIEIHL